jgi:hypothetical protein
MVVVAVAVAVAVVGVAEFAGVVKAVWSGWLGLVGWSRFGGVASGWREGV